MEACRRPDHEFRRDTAHISARDKEMDRNKRENVKLVALREVASILSTEIEIEELAIQSSTLTQSFPC